jgi:hypothetical protein
MNNSTYSSQINHPVQPSGGTATIQSPVKHLIALIPDSYFNPSKLAERIYKLSFPTYSQILLIGVCQDPTTQYILRQQLAVTASAMRDNNLTVEIKIETGKQWSKNLEQLWQYGDKVVGLTQSGGNWYQQGLNEIQQLNSEIQVHMISDLQLEFSKKRSALLDAILWLGAVVIMAGFFWIQIQIDRLPGNWGQSVLLYLSVFAEIGVLWVWNLILG